LLPLDRRPARFIFAGRDYPSPSVNSSCNKHFANGVFCDTIYARVEIRQYVDRLGRNRFERWFLSLDGVVRARIAVALGRMEEGDFSSTKSVGAGIHELRLGFGPGYRVYFGKDGEAIVILLAGGTKQRQHADIEAARALWQEYKHEKRGE
jgi:putative addiction module killer protein